MDTLCTACNNPLFAQIDPDSDEEDQQQSSSATSPPTNIVPDDCVLHCGHHFHWDCLLESFDSTVCPACGTDLKTTSQDGQPQLLINLQNEGGLQNNYDILPTIKEEAYVRENPEERRPRAFLEYCRTGDVPAMMEMLRNGEDEYDYEEERKPHREGLYKASLAQDILVQHDALYHGWSPLHTAIFHKRQEVAWLLLLVASPLDSTRFPTEVLQEATSLGLDVSKTMIRFDIRKLYDAQGRSAEALASQVGGPWTAWVEQELLTPNSVWPSVRRQ